MDAQLTKKRDKDEEKQYFEAKLKEEGSNKEIEQAKQEQVQQQQSTLYGPPSSPSHEFSFTIPLNPSACNAKNAPDDKTKPPTPSSFAPDLSPADDIFFHGHLLPLHLLAHLPLSPRNSLDSFTLPIKDLVQPQTSNINNNDDDNNNSNSNKDDAAHQNNKFCDGHEHKKGNPKPRIKIRPKAKSFSLFGRTKWRKKHENGEKEEKERQKKKLKFDVSHMLKRYMRMVRPLLYMKKRRESGEFYKQSYSFSGNVSLRHDDDSFEISRKDFSAPASMRTSPSNSGILVAKGKNFSRSSSDSTMEELQSAIQAAIAHCKNSTAVEEKIRCHD